MSPSRAKRTAKRAISRWPALRSLLLVLGPLWFARTDCLGQGEPPGTIKATTKLRPDGSKSTTIVDPDKRTAEETINDAGGKVTKKTLFLLNERNFATGAIHYDAKGAIRYKESYKRDAMDRITESTLFSKDDQVLGRRVFLYDAKGKAQIQDYDANGVLISAPPPVKPGRADKKRR